MMAAALAAGLATACWWNASAEDALRGAGCGGETLVQGVAGRMLDGRTFVLDDGREIRLAGIEVPPFGNRKIETRPPAALLRETRSPPSCPASP
jgi:hypothetical protein